MPFSHQLKPLPFWLLLFHMPAIAHEDLDLGIKDVWLDKQCYAHVQLVNAGRDLPESFYLTINPAFFEIHKGEQQEQGRSLRALDKKKKLQKTGGQIEVRSRTKFANNTTPISVQLHFMDEFLDYGGANNRLRKSMDCVPGKGQTTGEKIVPTQPDVAITRARIEPSECQLEITFTNLTGIPLDDSAWHETEGAIIMLMALDNHERLADISLIQLDPKQQFTHTTSTLEWRSPLPNKANQRWRLGLWRVQGDADFSNNQIDLDVPESCRE